MKSIIILFAGLCLTIILQAQVNKTVAVSAGKLKTLLTETELSTVTHLTLTGTIDARDIGTISEMHLLDNLDMSGTTIAAYNDTLTPYPFYYPENTIPSKSY